MTKFVVTTTNKGETFWLRGTTWAFRDNRADVFNSPEQAEAALKKAAKFAKPSVIKTAVIEAKHF